MKNELRRPSIVPALLGPLAIAIALTGCTGKPEAQIIPIRATMPPVTQPSETSLIGQSFPEVRNYYPQLEREKLTAHLIKTDKGRVKIFNFTDYSLDESSALGAYNYFESLASPGGDIGIYVNSPNEEKTLFRFFQRPMDRIVFIVPEKAPNPSWIKPGENFNATSRFPDSDISITLIKPLDYEGLLKKGIIPEDPSLRSTQDFVNIAFATAAFNTSILIGAKYSDLASFGQTILANSYGRTWDLKQRGVNYQDYRGLMELMSLDAQGKILPISLAEKDFNDMPVAGRAFYKPSKTY